MNYQLDHLSMNVCNVEAMISFYARILGLPTERLDSYRKGQVPFPSLRVSGQTIIDLFPPGVWEKEYSCTESPSRSRMHHFCLVMPTAQWKKLIANLPGKGIDIEVGPVRRWGAHGTGISVYVRDPENNLVELKCHPQTQEAADTMAPS